MDKIKVKYSTDNFKYQLRVPNDLEWFEICRYIKDENKASYVYMFVGEKIHFDYFTMLGNEKRQRYLKENEKINILKETALDLLNCLGINKLTLNLLHNLGFELKFESIRKLLEKDFDYVLYPNNSDKYDYDILDNDKVVGSCSVGCEFANILVLKNCKINLEKVLKARTCNEEIIESDLKILTKKY